MPILAKFFARGHLKVLNLFSASWSVILQAYIDDSYSPDGVFVLGGYIATAVQWADFCREWGTILPTATRGPNGKYCFKMSEMARHMDRVLPFYKIIEDHVLLALWCKINIADLRRAKERIWSDQLTMFWSVPTQPFWMCFNGLMGMFHEARTNQDALIELLPLGQKVDFYFDRRSARDAGEIASDWDQFAASQAENIRSLYGVMPRFEDDEEFLALQAADFWAWWVRRAYERTATKILRGTEFAELNPRRAIPTIGFTFSEDQLVEALISKVRTGAYGVGPTVSIFDAKLDPRPEGNRVMTLNSSMRARVRRLLNRGG